MTAPASTAERATRAAFLHTAPRFSTDSGHLSTTPCGIGTTRMPYPGPTTRAQAVPAILEPYSDPVKPAVAGSLEAGPHSQTGPLGIALGPQTDRLTAELVEAATAGGADLGLQTRGVRPGDDQSRLGVLLGIGYPSSLLPVFRNPRSCRRVVWVGEGLMPLDAPPAGALSKIARSKAMDYLKYPLWPFKDAPLPRPLARIRASATIERQRSRNLREVGRLGRAADRLVVTSRDRRAVLLDHGLTADAVPFGYAAAVAGPLAPPERGDRDLTFVSLGNLHSRLAGRRAVVERWRAGEPRLHVIDGAWGAERNDLLRRSRIVLNVARMPGEFVGIRLVLALAAGSVVVSEPMNDPYPFVAGEHFVEAPLDALLEAARELEADERRRRRIAAAGQALLATDLSMARCLSRVLGLSG